MAVLHTDLGASLAIPDRTLSDLDILDVGHTIQIAGALWSGNGTLYIAPLPDEDLDGNPCMLRMDAAQWERFLNQTDVLDVKGPGKAILRKSQRQIDQHIAWQVFRRDGFVCRYCGMQAPLTVDHVILWEQGGATVVENLISACRRCNKLRGNLEYRDWLASKEYAGVSRSLTRFVQQRNEEVAERLDELRKIVAKPRSR